MLRRSSSSTRLSSSLDWVAADTANRVVVSVRRLEEELAAAVGGGIDTVNLGI